MAQLPPDGEWLIQQNDGVVELFHRYTEEQLLQFDPADANATAKAQGEIHALEELDAEQKSFAHFWCGYFHAHAGGRVEPDRRHPMPGNVLMRVDDLGSYETEARVETADLNAATIVTSELDGSHLEDFGVDGEPLHRPVLDLDFPAALIPSSTPEHFHLYLNHAVTWAGYVELLDALAKVGVLEPSYVEASKRRGYTAVRLPWIAKAATS